MNELHWHLISDLDLQAMRTSLDDDVAEQAENEALRRRLATTGAPRLPVMEPAIREIYEL